MLQLNDYKAHTLGETYKMGLYKSNMTENYAIKQKCSGQTACLLTFCILKTLDPLYTENPKTFCILRTLKPFVY